MYKVKFSKEILRERGKPYHEISAMIMANIINRDSDHFSGRI